MIGRLSKFSRFLAMLIVFCPFTSLATMAKADCSGFAADVGRTFGVSLKRDPETRKVLGFYMVGEASFVAPKSSLVRKAKKKAFSNAKADFVRFMKEDFVATDLISDLASAQLQNTGLALLVIAYVLIATRKYVTLENISEFMMIHAVGWAIFAVGGLYLTVSSGDPIGNNPFFYQALIFLIIAVGFYTKRN